MAPYTTYFNYLPTSLAGRARRAYNTVIGADWNRDASEEWQKYGTKLEHHDLEVNEEFDAEEEWTGISQSVVRGGGVDLEDEAFVIKEYHGRPRQLSFKLSEKAAEAACEAAGVSREYLGMALKYVAVEVSRDIGWVMYCQTASDAVRAVKKKFPLLEDMQRAFEEGSGKPARPRSDTAGESNSASAGDHYDETPPTISQPGSSRPRSGSEQVYNPELHAGVEMVPVVSNHPEGPYEDVALDENDKDSEVFIDSEGFSRAL